MRLAQFKKLMRELRGGFQPAASWRERERDLILARVRRLYPETESQPASLVRKLRIFLLGGGAFSRAVGAAVLMFVLVFGGFIGTVRAARTSLPGDTFYSIKIGLEKAQIGLARSPVKKAKLEIAFASSRLKEVRAIITKKASQTQSSPEQKRKTAGQIKEAITNFNAGLDAVQKRLATVKKDPANLQAAVAISRLVNEETTVLEDGLLDLQDKIAKELSKDEPKLEQTLARLEATNAQSLAVIVERAVNSPSQEVKAEAVAKLQTKIQKIEKKIEAAENSLSNSVANFLQDTEGLQSTTTNETLKEVVKEAQKKPEEAKKGLEEAKKLLEAKDPSEFLDVLSKVEASTALVQDADQTIKNILDGLQ